ncbi:Protein of unknown function [Maridesulfovibrio ferrireducens]|uniref:DUF1007 family protein n=1 Tax=Maridesulfovibrio ferrireducens TaxID=246191 RepID=A0A1G9BS49_9BACT|nr:DUF1007 family protein [Maridesulfovibrio ferrireducens]SDK42321.1 Protein of unknown function [Maridesulfovibrio ferrireducens]
MRIDPPQLFKKKSLTLLLFFLVATAQLIPLAPTQAYAHPHVFVDCSLIFEFDSKGLKGVRQKWSFDEMFAVMILGDFDTDRNNILSQDEAEAIENGAFVNLKNFNYFTTIIIDGQPYTINEVTEFTPSIEKNTLVYEFFIPCRVEEKGTKHTVIAAIYDDSLYTAIQLDYKNQIKYLPNTTSAQLDVDLASELTSTYTQMAPEAAFLTFSPK